MLDLRNTPASSVPSVLPFSSTTALPRRPVCAPSGASGSPGGTGTPASSCPTPDHTAPSGCPSSDSLPWLELADAAEALDAAERHGTADELDAARRRYEQARDRLGLVAACIFAAAVSAFGARDGVTPLAGYVPKDVWTLIAEKTGARLSASIVREVWRHYDASNEMYDRLAALTRRVRELEARIDNVTDGVKEPR
jgi:hypothetical protein